MLVLAPTGRDGVLACQLLASLEVPALAAANAAELFQEIAAGAGAVILADEALHPETVAGLLDVLGEPAPLVGPAADRLHPLAARAASRSSRPWSRSATPPSWSGRCA